MEEPASKRRKIEDITPENAGEPQQSLPENLSESATGSVRANIFTEGCSICRINQGKYRFVFALI
jgi:hypothetical protein